MRAVHLTDLDIATRVLVGVDSTTRTARAERMIAFARAADLYRKRTGRAHPRWGAGALQDAARRMGPLAPMDARSPEYRAALMILLTAIATHHDR